MHPNNSLEMQCIPSSHFFDIILTPNMDVVRLKEKEFAKIPLKYLLTFQNPGWLVLALGDTH